MTWFDHTYTRYEKTDRCALLQVNCDFGELIYCPFCHQILVVIEPLLIDEDYYARVEGREIISNLAKVMWQKKVHMLLPANYSRLFDQPMVRSGLAVR